MTRWLITGAAGFIGAAVAAALLGRRDEVVGIDNLDPYYDPHLKLARLNRLRSRGFRFIPADVADPSTIGTVFADVRPEGVIHFAAQAGVRHALKHPVPYARTNLMGFVHVLEGCRAQNVEHVIYASSSSVYGETSRTPFSVREPANHPVSLYAATKRANELIAHSYSHAYGLPTTGLRFFTVYGPWGRPDMAYYAFARAIVRGDPVHIFGDGTAQRDFTYVDDVVESVLRIADRPASANQTWDAAAPDPSTSPAPFRLYNVGRGQQFSINEMIEILESEFGQPARRIYEGRQAGDVRETHADVQDLEAAVGFRPAVPLAEGLARFARWYRDYEAGSLGDGYAMQ